MNTMRTALCAAIWLFVSLPGAARAERFELATATLADIQAAMDAGALTSERLTQLYLNRIAAYDRDGPKLAAVLHLNAAALEQARALDAERAATGPRSPLHGVPVVAKDVFDTYDMPTTGGYAPLAGVKPTKDAFVIRRLREAGAIILAKVNQSDWYAQPEMLASSTLGGNTLNPYDPTRTPGWSSSGTGAAVAAVFAAAGLGSETGFSIRTPTSDSNLYGLASTSGLISRDGQMWSYITGERGGPMARNAHDLATLLDVIAGFDTFDMWTARSLGQMPMASYASFLDPGGLVGMRVGVLAEAWDYTPHEDDVVALAKETIEVFAEHGAQVLDPVSLGFDLRQVLEANGSQSQFERIHAIDHYLARQGENYPFKTAKQLLLGHAGVPTRERDVALLEQPVDLDRDPAYRATLAGKAALVRAVVELMDRFELDALIYPQKLHRPQKIMRRDDPARIDYPTIQLSPRTGLPALVVPMGFTPDGNPVGLEILGRPFSEPTLLRIASGYEAVTDVRRLPASTPSLPGEIFEY